MTNKDEISKDEISEEEMALLDSEIDPLRQQNELNKRLNAAAQNDEIYIDKTGETIPATQYMQELIDQGAEPTNDTMKIAAANGQIDNMQMLSNNFDIPITNNHLNKAISNGDVETARWINNQEITGETDNLELSAILSLNPEMVEFVDNEMGGNVTDFGAFDFNALEASILMGSSKISGIITEEKDPFDTIGINTDIKGKKIQETTDKVINMIDYFHDKGLEINDPSSIKNIQDALKDYPKSLARFNEKIEQINLEATGRQITGRQIEEPLSDDNIEERLEQFNKATGQNWQYAPESGYIYHRLPNNDLALELSATISSSCFNPTELVSYPHDDGALIYMDAKSFMNADPYTIYNNLVQDLEKIKIPESYLEQKPDQSELQNSFHTARDNEAPQIDAANEDIYSPSILVNNNNILG